MIPANLIFYQKSNQAIGNSPDLADALALTFAYPVAAQDHRWQLTGKPRHQYHYGPFQQAWSGRLRSWGAHSEQPAEKSRVTGQCPKTARMTWTRITPIS
jgi:hypothetical protein